MDDFFSQFAGGSSLLGSKRVRSPGSDARPTIWTVIPGKKNLLQDFRSDSPRATRDEDDPVRLDLPSMFAAQAKTAAGSMFLQRHGVSAQDSRSPTLCCRDSSSSRTACATKLWRRVLKIDGFESDFGPFDGGGLDQADGSATCRKTLPAGLAASEAASHRTEHQNLPLAFLQILCAGLQKKKQRFDLDLVCFPPFLEILWHFGPSDSLGKNDSGNWSQAGASFFHRAISGCLGCSGKRLEAWPHVRLFRGEPSQGLRQFRESLKQPKTRRQAGICHAWREIGREEKCIGLSEPASLHERDCWAKAGEAL